jgi:hypothetical protein
MLTLLLVIALVAVLFGLGAALEVALWAIGLVALVVLAVVVGTTSYLRRHL